MKRSRPPRLHGYRPKHRGASPEVHGNNISSHYIDGALRAHTEARVECRGVCGAYPTYQVGDYARALLGAQIHGGLR